MIILSLSDDKMIAILIAILIADSYTYSYTFNIAFNYSYILSSDNDKMIITRDYLVF